MRRLLRSAAAIVVFVAMAATAGACSDNGGSNAPVVRLDGSPRVPDVEGVATRVTLKAITIDGRRYRVSPKLQSFSTYDGSPAALLNREGQYVQAGVKDGVVGWLAGIGVVVKPAGTVFYLGDLVGLQKGRVVFRDGTTLRLGRAVDASARGRVRAEINASRGVVTTITLV